MTSPLLVDHKSNIEYPDPYTCLQHLGHLLELVDSVFYVRIMTIQPFSHNTRNPISSKTNC